MTKDIKDYLHLYLGCEVSVTNLEGRTMRLITKYEGEFYNDPKPILRPLSDMTEEERKTLSEYAFEKVYDEVHLKTHTFAVPPSDFIFLLSKGFDLFGLIEAGLAIDATTLKQNA